MNESLIARLSPGFDVGCPRCSGSLVWDDVQFAGMPILVACHCSACGVAYLLDWPAGHALFHPTIVEVESGAVHFDGAEWYPRAVQRVLASRERPVDAPTEVRARPPDHSTAVVVNCLDYVYGHCVLKLLSGVRYAHDTDVDLIMIVQKNVSWLVPSTIRTVEVDLSLSKGDRWIGGLDGTVKEILAAYATVQIGPTPSQPLITRADLAIVGSGFVPSPFWDAPEPGPPQITLLLREDRLWGGPRTLFQRLPLSQRLSPMRLLPGLLRRRLQVRAQNRRYATVVRQVQAAIPEARFVAVGLGRTGRLPSTIRDLRKATIEPKDELDWCAEYARSRVVVGIHGSHMLLPSALAGAVIDLLPQRKLPNIAQDMIIAGESESEPKLALFRYRILPEHTDPSTVSEIIVSILAQADRYHLNMIRNRAATGRGWPRTITWRRLDSPQPGP